MVSTACRSCNHQRCRSLVPILRFRKVEASTQLSRLLEVVEVVVDCEENEILGNLLVEVQFVTLTESVVEVVELAVVEEVGEQSSLGCSVRLCSSIVRGHRYRSSLGRMGLGLRYRTMVEVPQLVASTRSYLER
jgi:hypothetical protein